MMIKITMQMFKIIICFVSCGQLKFNDFSTVDFCMLSELFLVILFFAATLLYKILLHHYSQQRWNGNGIQKCQGIFITFPSGFLDSYGFKNL